MVFETTAFNHSATSPLDVLISDFYRRTSSLKPRQIEIRFVQRPISPQNRPTGVLPIKFRATYRNSGKIPCDYPPENR